VTDRYAVIGNPVAHSRSPVIHAQFAEQTGQAIEYERLLANEGEFGSVVTRFRESGAKGANVTLPFKEEAYRLAGDVSARARAAGAVNTLLFSPAGIRGDNTDGCGLVRDLTQNLGIQVAGRRVLVLGAGGAARGVLSPLLEERPSALVIANRTMAKAAQLASIFQGQHPIIPTACAFEELSGQSFDLVINATSAGLTNATLPLPSHLFASGALAYDMVYGGQTAFLRQALDDGASSVADGLGMLVEQAAESFFLWRGVRPLTAPVLRALRAG
jgi:shikimate dehydrogenase